MARAVFKVRDIDCATCALAIEKRVKRVGGVKDVGVAVMLNQVYIDYDESQTNISEVEKAIDKAGYSNYLIRREAK
jgi:Cu+-exporting ATPase